MNERELRYQEAYRPLISKVKGDKIYDLSQPTELRGVSVDYTILNVLRNLMLIFEPFEFHFNAVVL